MDGERESGIRAPRKTWGNGATTVKGVRTLPAFVTPPYAPLATRCSWPSSAVLPIHRIDCESHTTGQDTA